MPRLVDVVTTAARRARYEQLGLWDDVTLARQVEHWATTHPDRVAVVDGRTADAHTYGELHRDAAATAGRLQAMGVTPGAVVSVQMPNWYETVAVDLAVLMLGAVLNPLLPIYRERELQTAARTAGTAVFVTPSLYRGTDYRALVGGLRPHLLVDRGGLPGAGPAAPLPPPDAAAVSELIFSSGTEAAPKAIMHTEQTTTCGVRLVAEAIGLRPDDAVWMPSPIGHSTGLNYGVRMALHHGLTLTLQDRWDPAEAVRMIARFRPTYTVAATTFLADLLDAADATGADVGCLRLFGCGGAPVPSALIERGLRQGVTVLRLYGSTEALIGSWSRPDDPLAKRLHTEGPPLAHVELEVRDEAGRPVVGEPGELFLRSPTTSVGFFADPRRTAATFGPDAWMRSGDLGVLDADGYFSMVGRKKEILIRGGLNVAPREVEDVLVTMPSVREVAVVPLPHPRLGEIGCACVVTEPGASLTLAEVVAYLRARGLAPFKLPERLVLFDELPKTPTGKVRKVAIIDDVTSRPAATDEQESTAR